MGIFDIAASEFLCEVFQLGSFKRICGQLGGSYNVNVQIETESGLYVVRLLNRSIPPEHLQYTDNALVLLKHEGLPVLIPLPAPTGSGYYRFGEHFVQVTPYVEARHFQGRRGQVQASGSMLKRFHNALKPFGAGPKPGLSFYPEPGYMERSLSLLQDIIAAEEAVRVRSVVEETEARWQSAADVLPDAVIHGDWHFWNQFYGEDDTIRLIMDFDSIQFGKRIHDVAYALWVIYVLIADSTLDEAFLNGYGDMTDEEKTLLPIAVARVSLFFLCSSAYHSQPISKWKRQFRKQEPLIRWICSEGKQRLEHIWSRMDQPAE